MRENDFLAWVAGQVPGHKGVVIGVGDDMAGVRVPAELKPALALLKIDQALDRVHFDLREHTPYQAGWKAVNRCLSDCAAMACVPAGLLLSVALPKQADAAFAQQLFLGCQQAGQVFDCPVVGGDTGTWDQRLAITVAALGFPAAGVPLGRRDGAQAGDVICVTGQLGGSILGRHLTFVPRIKEAQRLAAAVPIHAMMDLSDGLAMDLPRLCRASGVGARVQVGDLPVHADAVMLAQKDGRPAAQHALADGEDYELLLAIPASHWPLPASVGDIAVTRIGTITEQPQLVLVDESGREGPWPQGGYEHATQP